VVDLLEDSVMSHPIAFRCRACGRLHEAEHAGENEVPHACSVCGAGVVLNPAAKALAVELGNPECTTERRLAIAVELLKASQAGGDKQFDPDNWEVLADCGDARLEELGIEKPRVVRHVAKLKGMVAPGKHLVREMVDSVGVKDGA